MNGDASIIFAPTEVHLNGDVTQIIQTNLNSFYLKMSHFLLYVKSVEKDLTGAKMGQSGRIKDALPVT